MDMESSVDIFMTDFLPHTFPEFLDRLAVPGGWLIRSEVMSCIYWFRINPQTMRGWLISVLKSSTWTLGESMSLTPPDGAVGAFTRIV